MAVAVDHFSYAGTMNHKNTNDTLKPPESQHVYANTNPDGTVTKTVTEVNPDARLVTKVEIISERHPDEQKGLHRPALSASEHGSSSLGRRSQHKTISEGKGLIFYAGNRDAQIPVGTSKYAMLVPIEQIPGMQAHARKTSLTTENDFLQDAIMAHNEFRGRHGVGHVTLDIELCKFAQAWANKLSTTGTKSHSLNGFGECLFWRPHGPVSGRDAVIAWYQEGQLFRWNIMDLQHGTNNFTQLIWKNTTRVGIALAAGGHGIYIVANYNPPGNIKGQFRENVLPLLPHPVH
ncbi:unnamed protein product [Allacma fusca]|uniref:SCP domain-containing protein n=1 Tax=Allacma fusca TaxID=39272 RepID=A0A8J2NKA9_9HEXA|nr:unnamed protein product [Allacma fusca]